jgi:5-oxopent-3-ene-1,2,5-tricarboxylate decarboxylase/2-hydroxyhepta-2,4-diene-1,7-dioate isomerase
MRAVSMPACPPAEACRATERAAPFPPAGQGPLAAAGVAGVPLALQGRATVYGVLLNHPAALAALGEAVHQPPYQAPPKAPVLYLKPRNTWVGHGTAVTLPPGCEAVEVGATLGLVIGRAACRVAPRAALSFLAGAVLVNDLAIPHESLYRPALRQRCRDGFCPIGPALVPLAPLGALDAISLEVEIDGAVVHRGPTGGRVRDAAALVADLSAFCTLHPGDVLLLGPAPGLPLARAGQCVTLRAAGLGALSTPLVAAGGGA